MVPSGLQVLALLALATCASTHVELEPVNVPHTSEERHGVLATLKATFGDVGLEGNTFNKIARTAEDHNCRGGCLLTVGTLATRQRRAVFQYDADSFEILQNETKTEGDTRLVSEVTEKFTTN